MNPPNDDFGGRSCVLFVHRRTRYVIKAAMIESSDRFVTANSVRKHIINKSFGYTEQETLVSGCFFESIGVFKFCSQALCSQRAGIGSNTCALAQRQAPFATQFARATYPRTDDSQTQ